MKITAALVKDGNIDKIYQVLELSEVAPQEEEDFVDSATLAWEEEPEESTAPLWDNWRSKKRKRANYFENDEKEDDDKYPVDEFSFTDKFVRPQRSQHFFDQYSFGLDLPVSSQSSNRKFGWLPELSSQPSVKQIGSLSQLPLRPPSWIVSDNQTSESELEEEAYQTDTAEWPSINDIIGWKDSDYQGQPQLSISTL